MIKKYVIYGEDPNCDFGGTHREPLLGYAEGEHEDVLAYAKTLGGWMTWGSGGRIEEYSEKTFKFVDKNTVEVIKQNNKEEQERRNKLEKEKKELEDKLRRINSQL